jgi:biotin transport system substrate-specific component
MQSSSTSPKLWLGVSAERFKQAGLVLSFVFLTAVAAQVEVPFYPVPMTLQSLVVLTSGLVLGRKLGAASQALYLFSGLALPVYAGGAMGFAYLVGPTGGYLLAFPLAAYVAGVLAGDSKNVVRLFAAAFAASVVIFTLGVLQLKLMLNLSWSNALTSGLVPFVLADVVKCGVGSVVASAKKKFIS